MLLSRALPVALIPAVALLLSGLRPAVARQRTHAFATASAATVSLRGIGAEASARTAPGNTSRQASATCCVMTDEALAETTLQTLPTPPVPIVLARISFEPGSGLPMTANPGLALHYVESGSFTIVAVGTMTLVRAATAGTPVPKVPISEDDEFVISPGDLLVIPANTLFEVRNTSQEPAIALIIELFGRDPGAAVPPG